MHEKLLEIPTGELLEKFGAGNHKPGSGSAAALQGMLAAQLIRTVISLSTDERRRSRYGGWSERFEAIDREIDARIYPALEKLVYDDSAQFDRVIELRAARDKSENPALKRKLKSQAVEELRPATEMPLEIAELCAELADFGCSVFDNGFTSARGDSGLAISSAASAIAGCLAIVDLNLLSFGKDDWTAEVRRHAERVRKRHAQIASEVAARHEDLRLLATAQEALHSDLIAIRDTAQTRARLSNATIEDVARELSIALWKHRQVVWRRNPPESPLAILDPAKALRLLGFDVELADTLGEIWDARGLVEIAGQIDRESGLVEISKHYPIEVRNFTAAHELGHALFHEGEVVLHRDRARGGRIDTRSRDLVEVQADKFAACFLMPARLVTDAFRTRFGNERFEIDARTSFESGFSTVDSFRAQVRNQRGLARYLAGATTFGAGRPPFHSLALEFGVSQEAMAIRLEELALLDF